MNNHRIVYCSTILYLFSPLNHLICWTKCFELIICGIQVLFNIFSVYGNYAKHNVLSYHIESISLNKLFLNR